jgi:ribosomal protein L5
MWFDWSWVRNAFRESNKASKPNFKVPRKISDFKFEEGWKVAVWVIVEKEICWIETCKSLWIGVLRVRDAKGVTRDGQNYGWGRS